MAGERPRAIRSLLVLGGGMTGLSAAAAFARALPRLRITLVETPPDPAALADRMTGSLPSIHRFHEAIGLGETELVRAGAVTHRLGTRFEGWSGGGQPWIHAYGDHGLPYGAVPFHQLWNAARRVGKAAPFHLYAAAGALADSGRFVPPQPDPNSLLSTFDYAFRLDPDLYRAHIAALPGLRLSRARGEMGGVQRREDGGVAALLLRDGRRFEADLFLDCAGPAAPLLTGLDGAFEDWSPFLPCDRLLIGETRAPAPPAVTDLAAATGIGWRWAAPGRGRTRAGLAYASATAEARARRLLAAEGRVDEAEAVAIRPGRRPRPWIRNVLALGDAAIAVDPLESTNLHLAQSGILRALELLPGRDCHPLELAEYNRRTAREHARIRDFQALHYLRSGRAAGAFWRGLARRPLPDSLAHSLHHFLKRGRLPFHEEESFTRDSWLAALFGMGLLPEAVEPAARLERPDEAFAALERFGARVQAETEGALPYADHLARAFPAP
jgi:tryptophan halogenase